MKNNESNLALWKSVFVTDPSRVKQITGKQYRGSSPSPYWIVQRATETFGPCGIGWGYSIDSERFERFGDTEVLHIAKVTVWYIYDGKRGELSHVGQTRAAFVTSKGVYFVDEDAPKKSITDALVKTFSMLGFAGDIFSGRWDDTKYVESLVEAFAEKAKSDQENSSSLFYSDDEFREKLPNWKAQIELGKNADKLIAFISGRSGKKFTDAQIAQIKGEKSNG